MTATTISIAPADTTNTTAPVEVKEPFTIDSLDRLTWYLRKVGNLTAERARIKAQADTLTRQIDSDLQSLTQHFGAQAEQFTREELARRGGKRKSLTTLQGTCSFRTVPGRLAITDDDAALVRAHALHLTQTTVATGAYLDAAKKALEETGELLPGVAMLDARETFKVAFKGEAESDGEGA